MPQRTHRRLPPAFGPWVLESRISEHDSGGCGLVRGPGDVEAFARWERRAVRAGDRCGPEREYEALVALADSALPRPLDLVRVRGWVVCIQEKIDGVPLPAVPARPVPGLARALGRIHARCRAVGWVHGDLKPENVLVARDGRIVVADWELARRTGEIAAPGTLDWAPADATAPRFTAQSATDAEAVARMVQEYEPGASTGADPADLLDNVRETALDWAAGAPDVASPSRGSWTSRSAAAFERWRNGVWCDETRSAELTLHALRLVYRVNADLPARSERCVLVRVPRASPRALVIPGDVRLNRTGQAGPHVLRRIVSVALGLTEVPADAMAAITGSSPRDPAELLTELRQFVQRSFATVVSGSGYGQPAAAAGETAAQLVSECADAMCRADAITAYRTAVRLTSRHFEGPPLSHDVLAELGDAWLELTNYAAADEMASELIGSGAVASGLCLRGRSLAAQGGGSALSALADELERAALNGDQFSTVLRLRALIFTEQGRLDEARRVLARTRTHRSRTGRRVCIEVSVARANLARARGKSDVASRVLDRNELRALSVGALRLSVSCRVNRLLSDRREPRGVRVERWASVAKRAQALCFWRVAAMAATTAAGIYLELGRIADARRFVEIAEAAGGLARSSAHASRVGSIRDALDDWAEAGPTCRVTTHDPELRTVLLHLECAAPAHSPTASRDDGVRWRALVARIARRSGRAWSARRTWSVAWALRDHTVSGRGTDVHASRVIVRSVVTDWDDVLTRARAAADTDEATARFALALVAEAVVWTQVVSRTHLEWLLEHSTPDEADRPVGVRRWEWRLAHAAARSRIGRGTRSAQWEGVAEALSEFAARLPGGLRGSFAAASPVRRVVLWALSDAGRGTSDSSVATAVNPLAGDVATLRTAAARRGAGELSLQRLLDCALRLNTSQSVDEALTAIVESLLEVCLAERAVVLFGNSGELTRAKLGTPTGVADIEVADAEISRSVLARARDSGTAILLEDAQSEELLGNRPSIRLYRPRSLMVCALRSSGRHVGYIYVENRSRAGTFGEGDVQILEGFAAQAALALENAALVEDLRTSYRQVSEARAEAVRAESLRVLGRLASEVAHDLNNLLTAILGEAQLLSGDPTLWRAHGALRVIERAAQDGAEVIRRIQDSTRRKPAADHADVDVGQVIEETLRFARVRIAARGGHGSVQVRSECVPGLLVRGIPSELREVFTNLVNNAVEAMPEGGTLQVNAVRDGRDVRVEIADTGTGIPPEVLARLFEPFFTTKGAKGNGLGLSIARGIARRHGGDISIQSSPGSGTRVQVTLPREGTSLALPESPVAAKTPETVPTTTTTDPRRFLIVDDDASVLRVLGQMLEQCGVSVDTAVGGDAALSRISATDRRYDVVVTDLYMPRISGLDVASEAQRRLPGTPVFIMSGCATSLESDAARKCGAVGFLRKPFTLDAVRGLARG